MRQAGLFFITLIILSGLLAMPGLAGEANSPNLTEHSIPENIIRASPLITFTPVTTIYLAIVLKPEKPPNDLEITELFYDSSDEYIEIANNGPGEQDLTGWTIESIVGPQTYDFPITTTIGAGESIRIHSGPDATDDPPDNLKWTGAYIWNNNGDKAELRDDQGIVIDSLCYNAGCYEQLKIDNSELKIENLRAVGGREQWPKKTIPSVN